MRSHWFYEGHFAVSQTLNLTEINLVNLLVRLKRCDGVQVNKDYLKKIKLFRARASPAYCAVAFQMSQDLETDDPM